RLSLAQMRNELLPPSLVREGDFLMLPNGFRAELHHDLRSPTTTFLETRRLGTCPRSGPRIGNAPRTGGDTRDAPRPSGPYPLDQLELDTWPIPNGARWSSRGDVPRPRATRSGCS